MDFSWTSYLGGLLTFLLLCLLFMGVMMLGCRGMMRFRCGRAPQEANAPQANGASRGRPERDAASRPAPEAGR